MNAQRADVWVFGKNSGLDFNTSPPQFITPFFQWSYNRIQSPPGSGSSITDCDGNLLLYASHIQVYNKNQKPMKNGTLLDNCNISQILESKYVRKGAFYNVLIVPNPSDSLKFYVISSIESDYNPLAFKGIFYSVVDLRLDNGLGAVDSNAKNIKIDSFPSSCLAVAVHANNHDLWFVTKPTNDSIYSFLVTDSMIHTIPVRSLGFGGIEFGEIKFSHDNKQLVCTYISNSQDSASALLYDFNRSTGKVSNPKPILLHLQHPNQPTWGIEFSPNDSLIYLSSVMNLSNLYPNKNTALFQVERFSSNIPFTAIKIDSNLHLTSLQLGHDNKIYALIGSYNYSISVIDQPNKKGNTCKWIRPLFVKPIGLFTTIYFPNRNLEFKIYKDSINCYNDSIHFINISDTQFYSYTWVFGDGDSLIVTDKKPVWHTYKKDGKYQVMLLGQPMDNNICTAKNRYIDSVTVKLKPIVSYKIDSISIRCLVQEIFVTDTTYGSILSIWDWGDSSVFDTGKVVSHIYTTSDTLKITLYSYNQNCMDTATKTVIISINPNPQSTIHNLQSKGCVPFEATFIDSSQNVSLSFWNWGDGSKTDTFLNVQNDTVTHVYQDTGTFFVTYINTNNQQCFDTIFDTVTVLSVPEPDFNFTVIQGCGFTRLICYNQSQFADTFFWNFGDGSVIQTTTIEDSVFYDFIVDSTYSVKLKASNGFCSDSNVKNIPITIIPLPIADFSISDSFGCEPFTISLTDNSKYHTDSIYIDFGDGVSDSFVRNSIVNHFYQDAGKYNLKMIVQNKLACKDSIIKTITVYPTPEAIFTVNDSVQCENEQYFIFTDSSKIIGDNIIENIWILGSDTIRNQQSTIRNDLKPAIWVMKLIIKSSNNCKDTIIKQITVHPSPNADFTYSQPCLDQTIDFTDKSSIPMGNIVEWNWNFGNLDSSKNQNPQLTFNYPNTYPVKLSVLSGKDCSADTTMYLKINPHVTAPEIDRVTVTNDDEILIEWIPPDSGNIKLYYLERSIDKNNFIQLYKANPYETFFNDLNVNVSNQSYIYRIKAEDSCNYFSPYSNIGTSILLQADTSGIYPKLSWNPYEYWKKGVSSYELYSAQKSTISNTENYSLVQLFPENENNFTDSLSVSEEKYIYYRIIAIRNYDQTESHSNTLCIPSTLYVYIPNAFSPNNDDLNDEFKIKGLNISEFEMKIFNRWGEMIFETTDIIKGWNGTYKDHSVPIGIYFYIIKLRGAGSRQKHYSGTINLIR